MTAPLTFAGRALAAIELSTLARGVVTLDAMAKRAKTTIVAARSTSPGRYFIVLSGSEAEVEEALDAGANAAREDRVDAVLLHDPAEGLIDALAQRLRPNLEESLLVVETTTICSVLRAADRALKEAEVRPIEMRLGAGLSGKGVLTLTGSLPMIQAAQQAAEGAAGPERVIRTEVIAQPHPDLPLLLLGAELAAPRGPDKTSDLDR